ncbi:LON peptidase N-terminal domain and RING finger protein 1 [Lachnellula cervina]|uniref:LON peptidase N-terminal domain and RING finger protein 1 n=1 Tax=Lachnellula cervina TaxID=1316786 RepID=A0A7D8USM1_9HELO|nr:LON peptidase N-terminal domain and RING finger protein 1 [Lachnellula cervina]
MASSLPLNDTQLSLRSALSKTSNSSTSSTTSSNTSLHASNDARQIVRLVQCPQCSYPLREPVTLPCGNSLCKKCIPESHLRENITYPATANRLQGFLCPFSACRKEHAVGDCSVNVVLNNVTELVREEIERYRYTAEASEVLLQVEERDQWSVAGVSSLRDAGVRVQVSRGGRLASTYAMAEMGELAYDSEVTYTVLSLGHDNSEVVDAVLLDQLKEVTRAELDCQVCYGLFLEPLTTVCGHTFCRRCVHRVLDHTNICPICRRTMSIRPGISAQWIESGTQQSPSNTLLMMLLAGLCPEVVAERAEAARAESTTVGELDTPLFICTLSCPTMPTFLFIFEPRYRLMIRRAVENGNGNFGMLLPNRKGKDQGDLGVAPFYQYGTLLHIVDVRLLPDGRSMIETVGVSRFRVLRYGELDGYTIGKVERIDDISLAAEEALEVADITSSSNTRNFSAEDHFGAPPHHVASLSSHQPPVLPDFNSMSTQDLMKIGRTFVKKWQDSSAAWLTDRVYTAYGECPEDPALFPWWFATVLPIDEYVKVDLLPLTSVRERLKMCVEWMVQFERSKWYAHLFSQSY